MKIPAILLFILMLGYEQNMQAIDAVALYQQSMLADYYAECDFRLAENCYEKLLASQDAFLVYENYITCLFLHKQYKKIIALSEKQYGYFSPTYKGYEKTGYMLAFALRTEGRHVAAQDLLKKLSHAFPDNCEIMYYAIHYAIHNGQYERALKLLQELFELNTQARGNYSFYFLRYQCHYALGNYSAALQDLELVVHLQPTHEKGWLQMALLHEEQGRLRLAQEGYRNFVYLTGDALVERKIMLLGHKADLQENTAIRAIKKACAEKDYTQAQILLDKHQRDLLDDIVSPEDKITRAALLQLDVYMAQRLYKEAYLLLVRHTQKKKSELWLKVGYLFYQTVLDCKWKNEYARFIVRQARYDADLPILLYGFVIALQDNTVTNWVESIARRLLKKLNSDVSLYDKVVYQLAKYYYQKRSYHALDRLLQKEVKNCSYDPLINLAAYFYTTKHKRLLFAQELCNKLTIDTSIYADTCALVLYKQKKYANAYITLKPYMRSCEDAIIWRHYAKICIQLGLYEEACDALNAALSYEQNPFKQSQLRVLYTQLRK